MDTTNMFLSLSFGWDATTGEVIPVTLAGAPVPAEFRLHFGPPSWSGDTSLPGPPDNWCFISWDLVGLTNTNTDPALWWEVVVNDPARATSNCGKQSAPGAGDAVTLCDPNFFSGDPEGMFSAMDWTLSLGGAPQGPAAIAVPYLATYLGLQPTDFFGGTVGFDAYPGPSDLLAWGSEIDAGGAVVLDAGGSPVLIAASDLAALGELESALYQTFVAVYFIF